MDDKTLEWIFDNASNAFDLEEKRMDKIRERANFIVSVGITPCIAVAAYLVTSLKGELSTGYNLHLFTIPLIISCVFLISSICFVAYVLLWGFKYGTPPSPLKILEYIKNNDQTDILRNAKEGLLNEYIESVENNSIKNSHRKVQLLRAQRASFISLTILIVFCIPTWVYNFFHAESKPQSIKIVSPIQIIKESVMPEDNKNQTSQQPATSAQTPTQPSTNFPKSTMALDSAPPKQSFPKSRYAAESYDPSTAVNKSK